MTTVQINLSDQLAQEAQRAGLLSESAIEKLLRAALRSERIQRMSEAQANTNFKSAGVAGLAVVCGALSNVTVLDIEAHALEHPRVKAWLELAGNAPRARSGGGGLHLYFSFAGEANKPLSVDGLHANTPVSALT